MNRWQDLTDMEVNQGRYCLFDRTVAGVLTGWVRLVQDSLNLLSEYCSEFLIHAADVEGLCQGIDEDLVRSKAFIGSTALKHQAEARLRKVSANGSGYRQLMQAAREVKFQVAQMLRITES